jgi:hypothetical protein
MRGLNARRKRPESAKTGGIFSFARILAFAGSRRLKCTSDAPIVLHRIPFRTVVEHRRSTLRLKHDGQAPGAPGSGVALEHRIQASG